VGDRPAYVLGGDDPEIARLDAQAAQNERATVELLEAAGVGEGMRVLDLGTGLGHVARLVATLVGPSGEVVGVDAQPKLLGIATARSAEAGLHNVRFVEGDVRDYREDGPFDAVVGRLILFHLADPVDVVRHHASALVPAGLFLAIDFDAGAARSEPPVGLVQAAADYILASFRRAGADPMVGARLASILGDAGLVDVSARGIQAYIAPGDPYAPAFMTSLVRTLAGAAEGASLPPELELETLEQRLGDALVAARAVFLPPTLVGAWGRAG
jgi:ubiquinone/menaquinone biosynthesis C-methylase UbiE